jgi:phage host-nuclease inhibitor protein Gam
MQTHTQTQHTTTRHWRRALTAKAQARRNRRNSRTKRDLGGRRGGAGGVTAPRKLKCWNEVDAVLAELGWLERRLEGIEKRRHEATARAEQEAAKAARGLEARRLRLAKQLERFCRAQGPMLSNANGHRLRSRRLLFGCVGFRLSQALVVREEAAALRALERWRAGQQFLRVRMELDREGLRDFLRASRDRRGGGASGLDAEVRRRLARAGIELAWRAKWFYEIDGRALERWRAGGAPREGAE